MNDNTILLGQKIRQIRISQGLSQEELALRAGMNPAHLGHIERGLKSPTIDTISKIADALNVELSLLFDFEQNTTHSAPNTKIIAAVSDLTERQQNDVLKLIKLIKHFSD